jgi:hypothetical protein
MPFNSKEEDDNDLPPLIVILLSCLIVVTLIAFVFPFITRKEYIIKAKIKAIYIHKDGQLAFKIKAATGVSRSRVYTLAIIARERGKVKNTNMPLKVDYIRNAARFKRLAISLIAIAYVLKIIFLKFDYSWLFLCYNCQGSKEAWP